MSVVSHLYHVQCVGVYLDGDGSSSSIECVVNQLFHHCRWISQDLRRAYRADRGLWQRLDAHVGLERITHYSQV